MAMYICELPNLYNLYITAFFVDQYPNNPLALEGISTFYDCKLYHPKSKWRQYLTDSTLQFMHTTELQT